MSGSFDHLSFDGHSGGFDIDVTPSTITSGGGGGTSSWELDKRKNEWRTLTYENQRRYDELYQKLLKKEQALDTARENARLAASTVIERKKLHALISQVAELRIRVEAAQKRVVRTEKKKVRCDDEAILMALYS